MKDIFVKSAYAVPVASAAIQADFPGFSFGTFRDPPGQLWADFVHDTDEFVVVAEGQLQIEVSGESALCNPGDLVRIPAFASHSLRTCSPKGSVWHYGYGKFGGANG